MFQHTLVDMLKRSTTLSGLSLAILLSLSHATNDAFANILPVFLPIFQERFLLGEAVLASFVAVVSTSSNVLQPFLGALADRWGRRRSAALGLIFGSCLMSFIAVVPSVGLLFIVLAVGGLGSALFHPAAASMAREIGTNKGLSMSFFTAGGPLGAALAPVLVLWIVRQYSVEMVPYLAVIGVLLGATLFVLLPPQKRLEGKTRPKLFDSRLFLGPVGLLALSGIMRSLSFISFVNAMPLWLVNVKGFSQESSVIALTLAVYSAAASAGVLLSGALDIRLGRKRIIVMSMLLALPFSLLIFIASPGSILYYVLIVLAGMFGNAAIPLLVVSAQDLAPHAVASASGMLMGFTWGLAGVVYIGFGVLPRITPRRETLS